MTRGCPSGVGRIACFGHRSLVEIAPGKHDVAGAAGLGIPAREYPVFSTELRKMLDLARCWSGHRLRDAFRQLSTLSGPSPGGPKSALVERNGSGAGGTREFSGPTAKRWLFRPCYEAEEKPDQTVSRLRTSLTRPVESDEHSRTCRVRGEASYLAVTLGGWYPIACGLRPEER